MQPCGDAPPEKLVQDSLSCNFASLESSGILESWGIAFPLILAGNRAWKCVLPLFVLHNLSLETVSGLLEVL